MAHALPLSLTPSRCPLPLNLEHITGRTPSFSLHLPLHDVLVLNIVLFIAFLLSSLPMPWPLSICLISLLATLVVSIGQRSECRVKIHMRTLKWCHLIRSLSPLLSSPLACRIAVVLSCFVLFSHSVQYVLFYSL